MRNTSHNLGVAGRASGSTSRTLVDTNKNERTIAYEYHGEIKEPEGRKREKKTVEVDRP